MIKLSVKGLSANLKLKKSELTKALNLAATSIGYNRENTKINILITDDKTIAKFHEKFLKDGTPTDVITFPMEEIDPETTEFVLGDLMISKETAIREARQRKIPIQKELILYAIHGFLHLNDFDDHSVKDRKKMHAKQNQILKMIYP